MKLFAQIMGILLIVSMVVFALCESPCLLQSEYSTNISVDKPDKIENAISNVVSDLEKKDFVPIYMEVKWYPMSKTYEIYARGIDSTKLRSLVGNVLEN